MFEFANFANGTKAIMEAVVHVTEKGATSIIGLFVDIPEHIVVSSCFLIACTFRCAFSEVYNLYFD